MYPPPIPIDYVLLSSLCFFERKSGHWELERETKREVEREMEKESADRQERTMGVQACIPNNKQSDGGGERGAIGRKPYMNINLKGIVREVEVDRKRGGGGGVVLCAATTGAEDKKGGSRLKR